MSEPGLDSYMRLQRVFWWARKAATIVAWILAGTFIWLQWKDYFSLRDVADSLSKTAIIKVALSIYYFSWIFACRFDLKIQESVYLIDPKKGALPKSFFWLTPLFLLVAGALLWAADHDAYLALFLSLFFIVDTVVWVFTRRWALPIAAATRDYHVSSPERCYYVERIAVVEELMCGQYQIYRHAALFVLILTFDIVTLSDATRIYVADVIHVVVPQLSLGEITDRLAATLLLLYVLACELSMWFMRVRAQFTLHVLEHLQAKYRLLAR